MLGKLLFRARQERELAVKNGIFTSQLHRTLWCRFRPQRYGYKSVLYDLRAESVWAYITVLRSNKICVVDVRIVMNKRWYVRYFL